MKKLFSLFAAVLFASSMFATVVTFTKDDFAGQGTANTGSEVTATKSGVTFTYSKGYCADESLRCYAHGALSITATAKITKINFTTTGGKTGGLASEVTVNATSYTVADMASQARFTEIAVTLDGEGGGDDPQPQEVDLTIGSGLIYIDAVEDQGWWQIYGSNDTYYITLSNGNEIETAAGTYTAANLDKDWSYLKTASDSINLCAGGSVTLAVADNGTVTVVGQLKGSDGKLYNINLTYKDPVAEQTVVVNISDAELDDSDASDGLYVAYGEDANGIYVQLSLWLEDFAGEFSQDDFDDQYYGCFVSLDEDSSLSIFSGTGTITPGNKEGVYKVEADLLCYNNTLYKVTMLIGEVETGIDRAELAAKVKKAIENGQVVISKDGVRFNVSGQVVR